jgi:hypothetical protein
MLLLAAAQKGSLDCLSIPLSWFPSSFEIPHAVMRMSLLLQIPLLLKKHVNNIKFIYEDFY